MQGGYKQIIKIERIQNPALYFQFIGRKKEMDKLNPTGHQNERSLFHGTSVDTCPKINQNGFNRSFAGKNGNYYYYYQSINSLCPNLEDAVSELMLRIGQNGRVVSTNLVVIQMHSRV